MKGTIVYLLKIEEIYDYEKFNEEEVYSSLEEAKKEFDRLAYNARKEAEKDEWIIETDDSMAFTAYLDGEYSCNHVEISIDKKVIK